MLNAADFGKMIAEKRKQKGLTQEELSGLLGISPQAVSKWENGVGLPDVTLFPPLAEALAIPIEALFGVNRQKEKTVGYTGPDYLNGLPFVSSVGAVAVYSNKTVEKCENGVVTFSDGSTANLTTCTVVNRGAGKIILSEGQNKNDASTLDSFEMTSFKTELDPFDSVRISLPPCTLEIVTAKAPALLIDGPEWFVNAAKWSVHESTFRLEGPKDTNRVADASEIKITLSCPFDAGKALELETAGSAVCRIQPDFSSMNLTGNGSGSMRLKNGDEVRVGINGSGIVEMEAARERFYGTINGSGRVILNKTNDPEVEINGSGSFNLGKVSGSCLSAEICGSGTIIAKGDVEKIRNEIMGSGFFDGRDLLCDVAEIELTGTALVTLDQIRRESIERVRFPARLNVKHR